MANEFKIKKGLIVAGASGGTVVDVQGSQGQLFSVTDDLSGSIFAVSDISGVPILDVNSSGLSTFDGDVVIGSVDSVVTGLNIGEASPTIQLFDTTNDGKLLMYMQDSSAVIGTYSNHALNLASNSTLALTIDISQNATFAGDVTVEGSHLKILNHTGPYEGAATDYLYVGGSGLDGTDGAIYLGNAGDDTGYGWRFFYLGSGSGNGNKLIIRSENAGSGVDALSFTQDGNATFATQAFSAATSSGDGSSTLTTKGYVDSLITGATIYRGAWDPSGGGYGSPDLSGVTQTSGYYYICSAAGTAEPNGTGCEPDSWETGDWVIWNDDIVDCAGTGTGGWQKIDNSSVLSGVGTGQTVALWEGAGSVTDSETLGNAPITVDGNDTTFTGTGAVIATGLFRGDTLNNQANTHNIIYRSGTTTFIAGGDKLVVEDGGHVGVGIADPISKFQVVDTAFPQVRINEENNAGESGIRLRSTDGTDDYHADIVANSTGGAAGYLAFRSNHSNERMRINSTGAIQFNAYGAGTLVSDASGNITVSSGGGTGGPYLPLSAGISFPLTGALKISENSLIMSGRQTGVVSSSLPRIIQAVLESSIETNNAVVHPYFNNDLGNFVARGGNVIVGGVTTQPGSTAKNYMFQPSNQFMGVSGAIISGSTWSITILSDSSGDAAFNLNYGCHIGITFGSSSFDPTSMLIETTTDPTGATGWSTALNSSAASSSYVTFASSSGTGIKAIRFTMGYTSGDPRVNSIFAYNYASVGMKNFFLGKDGGKVYGDIETTTFGSSVAINKITNSGNSYFNGGKVGIASTTPVETLTVPSTKGVMFGYKRFYSNTGTVPAGVGPTNFFSATLNEEQGTTLTSQFQYKFYLTTTGTGTYNSSVYIVYRNSADTAWDSHRVSSTGLSSNHPELVISGNNANIYNDHPSAYGTAYRVETSYSQQAKTSPQIFGSDYMWTRDNTDLYYMDGNVGIGTASPLYKLQVQDRIHIEDTTSQKPKISFSENTNTSGEFVLEYNGAGGGAGNYVSFYSEVSGWVGKGNGLNYIPSNGRVGIGTTSPQQKLNVDGNTQLGRNGNNYPGDPQKTIISGQGIEDAGDGNFYGSYGFLELAANSNYTGSARRYAITNGLDANKFAIIRSDSNMGTMQLGVAGAIPTGAVADFVINNTGNVGIGTSTPNAKLDVQGTQGQLFSVTDNLSGDIFSVADISGVPIMNVNSDGTSYFDGNVGIGTDSPDSKLDVKGPSATPADGNQTLSITNSTGGTQLNLGTAENSYGWIEAREGSTLRNLLINPNGGNVGIGTTSPNEKLDVAGKVYIEGNGQNWNEATPGVTRGSIHFDPGTSTDNTGNAITFGASDVSVGTNAQAGIYTRSDGTYGTKMYFATTDDYSTGSKTSMMIDYNGNVGIGTTSPVAKLEVEGDATSNDTPQLIVASGGADNNAIIHFTDDAGGQVNAIGALEGNILTLASQNELVFKTGTSSILGNTDTKMTIDTNGNVGIGTTSPAVKLDFGGATGKAFHLYTSGTDYYGFNMLQYDSGPFSTNIFSGNGGDIKLRTASGTSTQSTRLTVRAGGNVGINTVTPAYLLDVRKGNLSGAIARFSAVNAHVIIESSTAGPAVLHLKPNVTGNKSGQFKVTTGEGYNFRWSNDAASTAEVTYMKLDTSTTGGGDLTVKGDIIAYGAPSDERYKENIKPIESALDKALKLQGVTFDWKESDSILDIKEDIGFIAQDVQKVIPELVRENEDGKLSLRYQGVTPILLEAIKELKAEIEELKKQIK